MNCMPVITEIGDIGDLDMLTRGDLLRIVLSPRPSSKFIGRNLFGAYHGKSEDGQFQFVVPTFENDGQIQKYQSFADFMEVRHSRLILKEEHTTIESFAKDNPCYAELNRTLIMAGATCNNKTLARRAAYNLHELG